MPRLKNSDKILTDAKAAASEPVTFGLESGEVPVDEAHTVNNAAFNTAAMYLQSDLNDDEAR